MQTARLPISNLIALIGLTLLAMSALSATTSSSTAERGIIFSDGFEEGPLEDLWFFDEHNWRGTKEYVTENPHDGYQCLFMKGSDHWPGGASTMRPVEFFDEETARIHFWVRDFHYLTGTGGDGQFAVYIYDSAYGHVATLYENQDPYLGGGYVSLYIAGLTTTIASDVQLAELSGWVPIDVLYRSGQTPKLTVLVNNQTVIETELPYAIASFGQLEIGVGGQYLNTGEIYLDDFSIGTALFLCGDVNGDRNGPDISDLTYLVNYLFQSGPPPPIMDAANGDGNPSGPDIADVTAMVSYMFLLGPDLQCP